MQIDVIEVDGNYYGFSGCHRYEAHQRLGLPTIRCKVRRGTKETLRFKFSIALVFKLNFNFQFQVLCKKL
ncbi:hypothetical protein CUMW_116780 [Citrus unshiu]|nr:hypothetical protein CUMW_116780 [Citrus unshiu]